MVEFRTIKQEELGDLFDHKMYIFNNGMYGKDCRQYFVDHWYNDPWRDLDGALVAIENGKILSSVHIYFRDVFFDGERISMGGIGDVGTREKYRSKGLSSQLMMRAIDMMKARNIKISMLTTESRSSFYARFGWQQPVFSFKVSEFAGCDFSIPLRIRKVRFKTDLPALMRIYADFTSRYNGAVVRENEYYWNIWVRKELTDCWVVEDEKNEVIAYASIIEKQDQVIVKEFGAYGSHAGIFGPFITRLCYILGKSECDIVYPWVIESGLAVSSLFNETKRMYRLITPFKIGDESINTTEQLISAMSGCQGSQPGSRLLFWNTDHF